MRFPNQRLAQLFDLLQNETLPQDELAQRLSVSTRTVRADITALNALLASHGAQFILSRATAISSKSMMWRAINNCSRPPARAAYSANRTGACALSGGAFSDVSLFP